LDGTFNAVVRITGMRPMAVEEPGIEFLEYRTPPTDACAIRTATLCCWNRGSPVSGVLDL
jgi:hypothetical protein